MDRPDKPSPDFPLYAHASGKWAKKIAGRIRYFGSWADPAEALRQFETFLTNQRAAAGPVKRQPGLTIGGAVNAFLAAKERAIERGELTQRSWNEYRDTYQRLADHLGHDRLVESLTPADFAGYRDWRAQTWNLIAVGNEVSRVRSLFKWAHASKLIRELPTFGPDFRKPSVKAVRRHRRQVGKKLLTTGDIHNLLDVAGLQMKAMILLGINCGFGNTDCAHLPVTALDLDGGWVHYPRPKTEVDRSCPLWPETVEALRAWLRRRPDLGRPEVFLQHGPDPSWDNSGNPIAKRFRQIRIWAGLKRAGFYWLRHTFETVAGGSKDQVAVNAIMGHADQSMAAVYREEIDGKRLEAVAAHVRAWLFGPCSTS